MDLTINDELFCDEELNNTPRRHNKFIEDWTKDTEDFNFTVFDNPNYKGMVIIKDISFSSLCAHHLLPFIGKAHIGYIPSDKICGASKIIRALEKFAHKPQTQEKLTSEVSNFLDEKLKPLGVMVVIEAEHQCMKIRGVKNATSSMITSDVKGVFLKAPDGKSPKDEFLRLIK
jgi:GTP cyclohydrolase I